MLILFKDLISPVILFASLYDKKSMNIYYPFRTEWDASSTLHSGLPSSEMMAGFQDPL